MHATLDLAGAIAADPQLWRDFSGLCDCGGRLAGSDSEQRAFAQVIAQAEAATGVTGQSIPVPYGGWAARQASVMLPGGTMAPCQPLVRSVATPRRRHYRRGRRSGSGHAGGIRGPRP